MTPDKLVAIADLAIGGGLALFIVAVVFLVWRSYRVKSSEDVRGCIVQGDARDVRRFWTLHRPDGSIPLGFHTELEAITVASKLGARVTFVDSQYSFIFADTDLNRQGNHPIGDDGVYR